MLRKVEQALQAAIEKPFSRFFPQKLQPAELKAPLREALEGSVRTGAPEAPAGLRLAANRYLIELNPADVREIEAVGPVLEAELATDLQDYAAETRVTVGPYLSVTVGLAESVPAGEMRVQADMAPRPPAVLTVEAGLPQPGREVPLSEQNVIGRADDSDIVIGEAAVSRRHCEIVWQGVQYVLRDLGSANGTFVNSEQVQVAPLRDGDLIEVGFVQLRFHDR